MEHQVERLGAIGQAQRLGRHRLTRLEHVGAQLDVAGFVDAVHVAERRREEVPTALITSAESGQRVLEVALGGVELVVDLVGHTVFLAADHTDLDLQDDPGRGSLGQQFLGDLEVLVQRHGRAVPHVRLEERLLTLVHAFLRDGDQRADVGVQLVLRAVVGMQSHVVRVLGGHNMRELGQRHRSGDHLLDARARRELRTAGGELDDAVATRIGETFEGGVDGLRGRAVDGGVGESLILGAVEHLRVDLRGSNRHANLSTRRGR